jgi:CHAT domain-containing protein/Tfp pilus assembly protein PilF
VFSLSILVAAATTPANSQDARDVPASIRDSVRRLKDEGIARAREGKLKEAKKTFLRELDLRRKVYHDDHPGIGHTYVNLGVVHKMEGKMEEALGYYEKADGIYSANTGVKARKTATNYQNMANIYSLQKDYEKAENYYQRALELFLKDSVNNIDRLGMVYNNLGILMKEQGEPNRAIHYYQRSIQFKKITNTHSLSHTYGNLANLYSSKKDYKKAEEYFNRSFLYADRSKPNNKSQALDYMNYGVLKIMQGNYDIAENYLHQALNILHSKLGKTHTSTARCYENLGYLEDRLGNTEKALHYYQKGLISLSKAFNDSSLYANPTMGQVMSKTNLLDILKRKASALARLEKGGTRAMEASLNTYDLAMEVIKKLRTGYQSQESKLSLTANQRGTYLEALRTAGKLYQNTGDQRYLKKAFRYAEAGKAAVLHEAIRTNQALKLGNIPDSLREKENRLKKRIWTYEELIFEERKKTDPDQKKLGYWNEQIFLSQKEYGSLVDRFEKEYPRYYSLKYNQEVTTLGEVQKKLQGQEMLVEYVMGTDSIFVFVIGQQQARYQGLAADPSLTSQIIELRKFLSNRNFSHHRKKDFERYQNLAHRLHELLIGPLNLEAGKKITIIPDDVLSYLPFEVLVTRKQDFDRISYGNLAYLIRDHQIGYSYSARVLYNNQRKAKKNEKRLAAFAPTYSNLERITEFESPTRQQYREKLYPLKGIKKESRRIANIIKGDVYADYEATEAKFKETSGHYDILHLAMHTLVNDQNPMYSKMAFTQQKDREEEDGFLNTYEIYSLNLNSRMAVLSSCNTGSGKLEKGEGVISLARGFKYAGCPSIVMTMWPVEDNSSIRLMEYFYESLDQGKSKDEALRQAKMRFLENSDPLHAHPYFWAGYILIGDKSPLYAPPWIWWAAGTGGILVLALVMFLLYRKRFLPSPKRIL